MPRSGGEFFGWGPNVCATSQPGGAWALLPNVLVLENGALKILDPAASSAGLRLCKLVETP